MSIVAWHLHCGAKAEEGPIEDKVPLGWSLSLFEVGHNDQKLSLAMDVPTVEVIHAVEKGPMLKRLVGCGSEVVPTMKEATWGMK